MSGEVSTTTGLNQDTAHVDVIRNADGRGDNVVNYNEGEGDMHEQIMHAAVHARDWRKNPRRVALGLKIALFAIVAITAIELIFGIRFVTATKKLSDWAMTPPAVVLYGNGTVYFAQGNRRYAVQSANSLRFKHAIMLRSQLGVAAVDSAGKRLCLVDAWFRSVHRGVELSGVSHPVQVLETARDLWVVFTGSRSQRGGIVQVCKKRWTVVRVRYAPRQLGKLHSATLRHICCKSCPACDDAFYCVVRGTRARGLVVFDNGAFETEHMYNGDVLACASVAQQLVIVEVVEGHTHVRRLQRSGCRWHHEVDVIVSVVPSSRSLLSDLTEERIALALDNEIVLLHTTTLQPLHRIAFEALCPRSICFDENCNQLVCIRSGAGAEGQVECISLSSGVVSRRVAIDGFDAQGALLLSGHRLRRVLFGN